MKAHPKLVELADRLRADREDLLGKWVHTLRIGIERPKGELTDVQLRDHMGHLLEELCLRLERPIPLEDEEATLRYAEKHGDTRWTQGYALPELLRETASLRSVIIAAVVRLTHAGYGVNEQSLANQVIHRFFDALVVESASLFVNLAHDATVLGERQHFAQELHDGACQTFQSVALRLRILRRKMSDPKDQARDRRYRGAHPPRRGGYEIDCTCNNPNARKV